MKKRKKEAARGFANKTNPLADKDY
jgi:hypothetical protein